MMTRFSSELFAAVCSVVVLTLSGFVVAQESSKVNQSFHEDVTFLKQHTDIVTLTDGEAAVAVAPAYQGRVMTSTVDQENGASFGWINRKVIEAGLLSDQDRKGQLEEHIYIFGGEERFWLGPEGALDPLAKRLLGVSLEQITNRFGS